jgi:DNA-binding MarR family transcriptional regulator
MGEILKKRLKQEKFDNFEHESILNILVASNYIITLIEKICYEHNITFTQFNVLRILNGKYPEGYPRCDIINRMINPSPDVTRLIDRLIRDGFVERFNSEEDRRLSLARITEKGRKLLSDINPKIRLFQTSLFKKFSKEEKKKISVLLEKIYAKEIQI